MSPLSNQGCLLQREAVPQDSDCAKAGLTAICCKVSLMASTSSGCILEVCYSNAFLGISHRSFSKIKPFDVVNIQIYTCSRALSPESAVDSERDEEGS